MSVRKIIQLDEENGRRTCALRGLRADYGKVIFEQDGMTLELDEPMDIVAGKTYTVQLPHTVKVEKGVILSTIPKDLLPLITSAFMPPTLSVGIYDDIHVTFKAKESGTIKKVLKLHMLELSV